MRKFFTIFIFLTSPFLITAQSMIELDRPDQTETSSIVPKYYLQLESGYVYEKTNSTSTTQQFPSILTRYGLSENTELRFITEFNFNKINNIKENKFQPITVGFKTALGDNKGILPAVSFLGHLEIFVENDAGKKQIIPSFKLLFDSELTEGLNLGYNLGIVWDQDLTENYTYTMAISKTIHPKWTVFVESYGFISPIKRADHRMDTGITYFINDNSAIDIAAGKGLSSNSPSWFLSAGYSFRFDFNK